MMIDAADSRLSTGLVETCRVKAEHQVSVQSLVSCANNVIVRLFRKLDTMDKLACMYDCLQGQRQLEAGFSHPSTGQAQNSFYNFNLKDAKADCREG